MPATISIEREIMKTNTVKVFDTVRAEVMRSPSKYFLMSYHGPWFCLDR